MNSLMVVYLKLFGNILYLQNFLDMHLVMFKNLIMEII